MVKIRYRLGDPIAEGGESRSGLYGVCKASNGWCLRITMFRELADLWRHPTRVVREVMITSVEEVKCQEYADT